MACYQARHDLPVVNSRHRIVALRPDDRRVLGSFYGGAGSCRETARECAIPVHLVKVRLYRARKRLTRALRRGLSLEGTALGVGVA